MIALAVLAVATMVVSARAECDRDPWVIEYVSWYYDGGTVGVALTDSLGCQVEFCVDQCMGSETWGRIYVGAKAPSHELARLATEQEVEYVIGLAKRSLNEAYPEEVQQEFLKMVSRGGTPSDDYRAWLLLRTLRRHGWK
jgi:hypothetical protein